MAWFLKKLNTIPCQLNKLVLQNQRKGNFHLVLMGVFNFCGYKSFLNACLCSFLTPFPKFLWPCYAFLIIDLVDKFDGHVMKATRNLIIHCTILVGLWHHVFKASALEHLLQPQVLTIDLLFQSCGQCSYINTFIFHVSKFLFGAIPI